MKLELNLPSEKINARVTGFIRDGKDVYIILY